MHRSSTALWRGNGLEGKGQISTQSGAFADQPYGFGTRFASEAGKAGTNPEELIGAAHAACFTMALAFRLTGAGHAPEELRTEAKVHMYKGDAGWLIPTIHLTVTGKVAGLDAAAFTAHAEAAKATCPVSRALAATPITLAASLG